MVLNLCEKIRRAFAILLGVVAASAAAESPAFVPHDPGFRAFMLHDIGVADFNGDGNLDIFTTNCFSPPNLVVGDGHGGFQQVRTRMGLDLTPEIPGFGACETPPVMDKPGLYLYIEKRYVCVQSHNASGLAPMRGSVRTICRENITEVRDAEVCVDRRLESSGIVSRTITFSCGENGLIRFRPEPHLIDPMTVTLDESVPLDKVFMGPERVPPPSRRFDVFFQDPHSMAWADINADGRPDVFIGRGAMLSDPGLDARIAELQDRLLLAMDTRFDDVITSSGIRKNGCPNRKSCWVDANGDGLLDLFYTGARGARSALYVRKQLAPPLFEERAGAFGVDNLPHGGFCWRDLDYDGRADLAASMDNQLVIFWGGDFSSPHMARSVIAETGGAPYEILASDYNGDGMADLLCIFLRSEPALMLFTNKGGRMFDRADLAAMGLPDQGMAAAWCDYDNDGRKDLAILPGDLYRSTREGHFEATGWFADVFRETPAPPDRAWISWFDMDNNGTRDLLAAVRLAGDRVEPPGVVPDPYLCQMILLKNTLSENRWIAIDLTGPDGNRPAIGARVAVHTGALRQTQEVGENEGSENSQGHYRLYFGLGAAKTVDAIDIHWPDGTRKTLANIDSGQVLRVAY